MKRIFFTALAGIFSLSLMAQSYRGLDRPNTRADRLNETYCTGLFKSTEGTIIEVKDDMSVRGHIHILDWLRGRVAGLQVYYSNTGTRIPVIRGGVPAIFIDEMQVSPGILQSLNLADIALIKIIRSPFYGGFNGGSGAIAIYTIDGEEENE